MSCASLIPRADADTVHDELVATVPWEQGRVFRYERWVDMPRLEGHQSGSGRHPALVEVEQWISRRYRVRFDGVALAQLPSPTRAWGSTVTASCGGSRTR